VKTLIENAVQRVEEKEKIIETEEKYGYTEDDLRAILREAQAKIKVMGTGGAGCNAIQRLIEVGIVGAEAISVNTDAQDLLSKNSSKRILIGKNVTKGLGAGNDPRLGEEAAREDERLIKDTLEGADMVFVTCGLGGGTGTGSAPIIAEIAKKIGALTVAIVTIPFTVEGIRRQRNAERGLENLRKTADTVIVIPNDKLLEMAPGLPISAAFKVSDDILIRAVMGITDLITKAGLVNLDFADVKSVMRNGGVAMIGLGESDTENRAVEAVEDAFMKLEEAEKVVEIVSNELDPEAQIIWGAQIDEELKNALRVMVVVSGVSSPYILGPKRSEMYIGEEGERFDLGIDFL